MYFEWDASERRPVRPWLIEICKPSSSHCRDSRVLEEALLSPETSSPLLKAAGGAGSDRAGSPHATVGLISLKVNVTNVGPPLGSLEGEMGKWGRTAGYTTLSRRITFNSTPRLIGLTTSTYNLHFPAPTYLLHPLTSRRTPQTDTKCPSSKPESSAPTPINTPSRLPTDVTSPATPSSSSACPSSPSWSVARFS